MPFAHRVHARKPMGAGAGRRWVEALAGPGPCARASTSPHQRASIPLLDGQAGALQPACGPACGPLQAPWPLITQQAPQAARRSDGHGFRGRGALLQPPPPAHGLRSEAGHQALACLPATRAGASLRPPGRAGWPRKRRLLERSPGVDSAAVRGRARASAGSCA